ncbi:Acetyltransferase [Treponema sp. JC4]|uniref:GNAT family N-acetyltransferase n=1 Tax=Treponema sp. JC4 TaxID=1124982 RepID=UPI00025B0250|nr:GNAT family N-acetyltransferase [Treponema sp. JC4]EID85861.1 Acetyltransferase [Treponema sp. JC4]
MNLSYRILDCDIFESYMALEGWENFPLLQSYTTQGEFPFLLKDCKYMIFDYKPSSGFLKAVCIYKMIGDTLIIDFFEVNKNFRHQGLGTRAMERLMLETGAKKVVLEAKDTNAAIFWKSLGMKRVDEQTFTFD